MKLKLLFSYITVILLSKLEAFTVPSLLTTIMNAKKNNDLNVDMTLIDDFNKINIIHSYKQQVSNDNEFSGDSQSKNVKSNNTVDSNKNLANSNWGNLSFAQALQKPAMSNYDSNNSHQLQSNKNINSNSQQSWSNVTINNLNDNQKVWRYSNTTTGNNNKQQQSWSNCNQQKTNNPNSPWRKATHQINNSSETNWRYNMINQQLHEQNSTSFQNSLQLLINDNNNTTQLMFQICGIPGSGKSTLAKRIIENLPEHYKNNYECLNQDRLGTRQNVEYHTDIALKNNKNIIIDRCNFNKKQRLHWIQLCKKYNINNIYCIIIPNYLDVKICSDRAYKRGNSQGVHDPNTNWNQVCNRMAKEFVYPDLNEGFKAILHCKNENDIESLIIALITIGLTSNDDNIPSVSINNNNSNISNNKTKR